jgi:oxygen-independent coproporphyrinogen-3 oxidase
MTDLSPGPRSRGVYVHVPFCRRRCPYCDFYFEVGRSPRGFVDGVAAELAARHEELTWPAHTLSFGGGTPSQLPADELARLVALVRTRGLHASAEVTLEVNPEDVDDDLALSLRQAGFTRASIGLQSFDDDVLSWLGRAHDGAGGAAAVTSLVRAGLSVGIDLIVGVPGEKQTRVRSDLMRAVDLGAVHVSAYLLTVEPETPLVSLIRRGKRRAIDDDAQADAYERVQAVAHGLGFRQYEISSWAQPGSESRHNRLYWQRGSYLGLGPGAHSFAVDASGRAIRRHTTAKLDSWLADPPSAAADIETLEQDHALREATAFGLRDLVAGVDVAALALLHHTVPSRALLQALARVCGRDHVVVGGDGRFRLTGTGARFADAVAREILSAGPGDLDTMDA